LWAGPFRQSIAEAMHRIVFLLAFIRIGVADLAQEAFEVTAQGEIVELPKEKLDHFDSNSQQADDMGLVEPGEETREKKLVRKGSPNRASSRMLIAVDDKGGIAPMLQDSDDDTRGSIKDTNTQKGATMEHPRKASKPSLISRQGSKIKNGLKEVDDEYHDGGNVHDNGLQSMYLRKGRCHDKVVQEPKVICNWEGRRHCSRQCATHGCKGRTGAAADACMSECNSKCRDPYCTTIQINSKFGCGSRHCTEKIVEAKEYTHVCNWEGKRQCSQRCATHGCTGRRGAAADACMRQCNDQCTDHHCSSIKIPTKVCPCPSC
jgi:hypothetical protein